ncbi:hypothetical protein ACFOET_18785 [Parapedobacter deserti]|uniref:YfhD family protein n=1 Tax=Parapedobacter deserti TaxID=1912957 RepID=A0ABV7JU65_9SPHI
MTSNKKQHPSDGEKQNGRGMSENDRAAHTAFDKLQQYDDAEEQADTPEKNDPEDDERAE